MSLRLIKRADSPGLNYVHPETGQKHFAWDMTTLFKLVTDYRTVNNLPVVDRETVEDQVCQTLGGDWCQHSSGGKPQDFIDLRLTPEDVLRGTMALGEIAARRAASALIPSWSPFVDQETAEARAATCATCYAKAPLTGCRSCDGFVATVQGVIGDRHTKSDHLLVAQACGICKCAASVQVHIKDEILARGIDDAMRAKFAQVGHCWKNSLTNNPEQSSPAQ